MFNVTQTVSSTIIRNGREIAGLIAWDSGSLLVTHKVNEKFQQHDDCSRIAI